MEDENNEHAQDYFYMLGISSGLKEASGRVMSEAKECFAAGQDPAAARMRTLALGLIAASNERRPPKRCHTYEHTAAECPGDHGK